MELLVVPPLKIVQSGSARVTLTRKFVDGMAEYCRLWPGQVALLSEPSTTEDDNLDHVTVDRLELPFRVSLHSFSDERFVRECFCHASVVMATLDSKQADFFRIGEQLGVPVVYVAEQSLQTRQQNARGDSRNPLRRWRRYLREPRIEAKYCEAVRNSAGVQCNGTPTYEAYRSISPRPMLYFDSRVTSDMIVAKRELDIRTREAVAGHPLRLAFSGRLIGIKGVDHLPRIANALRGLGVQFTMDIFGSGGLEPRIREEVARLKLDEVLRLRGTLAFRDELVPEVTRNVDLFVCCHRQGDPSCTYLETMSCGVPIVGYDNEAFLGLVKYSQVGWVVTAHAPEAMAMKIAELDRSRKLLATSAYRACEFAKQHDFQATMRRRVEHMLACAYGAKTCKANPRSEN